MGLINYEIPSIPGQRMNDFTWLVTGRNKIGKTTLASNFPKPYFFMWEPGTSALLSYETDILKVANKTGKHPWVIYKKAIQEFIENDGYGFKTAVTDPYGVAFEFCSDYICDELGISDPGELGYGQGWRAVADEFKGITRKLAANDFTPLFIAHMDAKNLKDGMGNEKDVIDLDITGKSGKFVKNFVDIFLMADFDENGERKLFIRPTTNKEGGSRLDFGKTTIDLNYKELENEFKNSVKANNEKLGVTDEMIEQYYAAQEKEKQLVNAIEEIKQLCQSKSITLMQHRKLMENEFGFSEMSDERFDLSKAEQYKKVIESQ